MPADEAPTRRRGGTPASDPFSELLRRTHLSAPAEVGGIIVEQTACLGALGAEVYMVDYEQQSLSPLTRPDAPAQAVVGTLPGRAFTTTSIVRAAGERGDDERVWIPLLDGTERLGVMALAFAPDHVDDELLALCERYAHLSAMLLLAKSAYGDGIERVRRRRPMTLASELAWNLAPPLVCATGDLVLTGMLEPCYDNGGDAFDYALNDRTLHVGVFDAMGHGLAAAGVAAFAVSAYRHSRRRGHNLVDTYHNMDRAVGDQFPGDRFVTAIIAELDLDVGELRWISAGHPLPLVLRGGRRTSTVRGTPTTPLGVVSPSAPTVERESLEPGDLLLFYTDGLTEASRDDGRRLGVDGISEYIEREAAAGLSIPETLRRLRETFLGAAGHDLGDDVTAVLVEWRRGGERDLLPQTAA